MTKNSPRKPLSGGALIAIGGILVFFGSPIISILVASALMIALGHPHANTRGLAVVNVATLLSSLVTLITGMCMLAVGIVRASKKK